MDTIVNNPVRVFDTSYRSPLRRRRRSDPWKFFIIPFLTPSKHRSSSIFRRTVDIISFDEPSSFSLFLINREIIDWIVTVLKIRQICIQQN